MKVFLTGGTGNIGQYVTRAVLDAGHEAVLLVRNPDKIPAFKTMPGVTIVRGDMHDQVVLEQAVTGCDAVIHIALGWGNSPLAMLQGDTAVTAFLLETAQRLGVKKFIYTSSTAAAGDMTDGENEDSLPKPTDLYGATKASSEMFLMGFRKYYDERSAVTMKRNVIRPGYTFSNPMVAQGASQSDDRFRRIARAIVRNEDIAWDINDGTQFISSRQIAQLYVKLLESNLDEQIFYGLSRTFIRWHDVARAAADMTPGYTATISGLTQKQEPAMYDVSKMERYFGLSFDGWEDLTDHIRWNLEQARAELDAE